MKPINKKHCTVFTDENNFHMIMLPSGEILPCVITTRVTDPCEGFSEAFVKLYVNIVKDKEEAMKLYREDQK